MKDSTLREFKLRGLAGDQKEIGKIFLLNQYVRLCLGR